MDHPVVLTIAGFDPSGGAGIGADLKTIAAHGCYGVACITALTVQSTLGVRQVDPLEPELVLETLSWLAADFDFKAIRIGMLGNAAVASAVAEFVGELKLKTVVLDPVLISSSGMPLLDSEGVQVLKGELFPNVQVVTPNLEEAVALAECHANLDPWALAEKLSAGSRDIIITCGSQDPPTDLLLTRDGQRFEYSGRHIETTSTHGTGCALATSLACHLALGLGILEALPSAKDYVTRGLAKAYPVGKGKGPINHFPDSGNPKTPA